MGNRRVVVDVIQAGLTCVYRMDSDPKGCSLCKHNGNMEAVTKEDCEHCVEGMTREEAIAVMKEADIDIHNACHNKGRRPTDEEAYGAMLDALIEKSLWG